MNRPGAFGPPARQSPSGSRLSAYTLPEALTELSAASDNEITEVRFRISSRPPGTAPIAELREIFGVSPMSHSSSVELVFLQMSNSQATGQLLNARAQESPDESAYGTMTDCLTMSRISKYLTRQGD